MAVTEVGIRLSLEGQGQVSTGLNGAADSLNKIDGAAQKVVNSAGKLNDSLNVKGTGLAAVSDSLGKIDKAAVSAATGTTKLKDALGNISHEGDGMASLASKIGMVGASAAAAAAAVGMVVKSLFEASAAGDRLKTMLDFATGNGVKEIDYLRGVTNRLGLEFASTAVAYGQFQAAAKGTALEGQKAKDVFESISKASAVMGLSADQTQGALLALQQMISKGTVQAEELRGQLGERLPGAFQIAAKAMGVTTAELGKMLEQGQVVADDFLPKFAAALNENLGGAAEKSAARLDASVNRFASAWDRLKQAAGDSGISEGVASGLGRFATGLDTLAINMERMNKSKSLSEFFDAAFYSVASTKAEIDSLGKELTQAQAEFEALKKQGNTRGGGFYYEAELGNLAQLIAKLKEAISTKSSLMNTTDPRDQSGYQSRSQGHAAYSAKKAAESKAIADLMADSSGVTAAYIKRAKEIQAANANEGMSVDQLAKAWDSAHSLLKKNTAGVSEAKKAARDYAKELETQADTLAKLSGYNKDYEDQASRLVEMRQKGMFTEEGYLRAVNELVAAQPGMIKLTKDQADAAKEAAKAQEIASKAYDDSLKSVQHFAAAESESLVKAIEAQRLHNEQIGKTPEQIELVKRAVQDRATVELEANAEILQSEITLAIARDSYDNQTLELWNAQLKSLREQITLRKQLAGELNTGAALESVDALGKANKKAAEESSKYWEDALMRAFESGKGFFDSLWDTIKNTLKTQVLKVSLQAIGIGGAAGGAAAADVSNIFSTAENASSMGSMFASAFPTAAATISTVGNAALAGIQSMIGMTGTAAQAATAAANGIAYATTGAASTAASAGSMIAAAGPYVAAAMGIYAIHQATQGETRIGGEYRSNIADGAKYVYGPSGGDSAASQVKLAIDTTTAAINATLKQVGSAATLVGFAAGYETSGRDRGGAYAGGTLSTGVRIGQDGSGDNYAGTKYDPTKGFNQDATGAVKALDLELKQSIIETLQAAGDIPQAVTKVIDDALARANADSVAKLSAEATDSTLAALNTVIGSVEVFNKIVTTLPFKDLADLSFDAAAGLIEFSGGIDNLAANLGGFYANFYAETEQIALKTEFASKAFADLGVAMPAIDGSTRDWYKSLINTQLALDQSDPAIAKVTAGLLGMQGAVNDLAPVAEVIKSSIAGTTEAIKNQAEWQTRLDIATGKTTDREVEKAAALLAGDAATDKIINAYYDMADPAITKAIVDAQNEVAIATGQTTQLEIDRAAALASANEATRPLVATLYDLKAAAASAATLNAIKEKYTTPLTVSQANATLPTGIGDKLLGMDSAGFRAAIQQYADDLTELGADGYAGSQQLQSFTAALDIMLASIEAAEAVTKSLADESKNLAAQLLKAKGDMSGYRAASTAIATAGYTPAQTAAYTDNATTTTAIGLLDAFKPVLTPEAALAALPSNLASNVAGQSSAAIAEYVTSLTTTLYDSLKTATTAQKPGIQARLNELMDFTDEMKIVGAENDRVAKEIADAAIAAAKKASEEYAAITKGLETEAKNLNIALLEAQGNFTGAKDAARTLAIEGMDALQIAMWDTNAAVKATTASLTTQTSLREKYAQPMTLASAQSALPADLQTSLSTSTDPRSTIVAYAASLDTSTVAGQNAIESLGKLTGALDFLVSASDTAKAALKDLTGQTDTENATRGMTELEKSIYAVRVKMSEMTTNLGLDGTLTADEKTAIENYGIAMMTTLIEAANTKAADIMAGVNTEFENLGKSDLEITLAGITKKGQDFKDSIEALGNTTPATTAAIDKLTASLANNAANDVLNKFKLPETVAQATATLSTAGFDVTGLDTAGINKYFTDILTGPGMQDAAGDWTKAGLAAVTAVDKVTGSIGTLTTASDKVLAETKGLTDQLNTLRDTEAQALTRQRDALDENNRAIFDQVTAWTKFNGLLSTFIVPETTSQATATVTAAGFDVTGLDSTGIAAYVNSLLSDIKLDPTLFDPIKREFTTAGQIAVNGINGVAGSFKTLASASSDTENITKGLETEAKNLGVALLEAQGNTAGAKAATRALATEGMDALQISLWDTNTATKELTASLVKGNTERQSLQDEYDTLTMTGTELLEKQRSALEESNWARFDEINAIKLANSERDKNQGLQGRLITAGGNEAAITEWNRSLELAGDWTVAQKGMLQAIYAAEDAAKANAQAQKAVEEARAKLDGQVKTLQDLMLENTAMANAINGTPDNGKAEFMAAQAGAYSPNSEAAWDLNAALKAATQSLEVIAGMKTELENSEIALMRARGNTAGANAAQTALDIKNLPKNQMTATELADLARLSAERATARYYAQGPAVDSERANYTSILNARQEGANLYQRQFAEWNSRYGNAGKIADFDSINVGRTPYAALKTAQDDLAAFELRVAKYASTVVELDTAIADLADTGNSTALALYKAGKAIEAEIASIGTKASIWDKFASDDQKKAKATADLTAGFAAINTAIPATAAEFLALSQAADPATEAGRLVIDTLGGLSDAFALLHPAISATTDITKEYQRALLTAQGDTAGIAAIDKADLTATRTAAGWTPEQIKAVFDAEDVKKLADANSAYTRALLEASGDTSGLTAFDKAVSDAALLAAGWTQVQIDAVDTATETAKIATATKDYNRALLDAAGDTTGIAAFDKAISDAAKLAAGWTQAQINAVDTATANTKATEDAKTLSDTNKGWQDQLDVLTGTRTQTQVDREKQLTAATDESTKALMRLVFAQQDYKRIVDERAGLTTQLLQIEGDTAALRAAELAKIDPLNRALQQRVWALQDEKTAQAALQSASTAITQNYITASDKLAAAQDTVNNLVKEAALQMHDFSVSISEFLRTLDTQALGDGSPESRYRALAADFRSTSAKANTGDKDAIGKITGVASDFLAASKDYFATGAGFTSDTDLVRKALGDIATKTGALGAAAAASADPMVKAQSDLTKAMREMAVANNLIRESGADTALATTDLLADFRKAQTDLAAAQASAAIWKAADDAAQITRDNLQLNATTAVVSTAAAAGVTANAAVVDSPVIASINTAANTGNGYLAEIKDSAKSTESLTRATTVWLQSIRIELIELNSKNAKLNEEVTALRAKVASMESNQRLAASAPTPA